MQESISKLLCISERVIINVTETKEGKANTQEKLRDCEPCSQKKQRRSTATASFP